MSRSRSDSTQEAYDFLDGANRDLLLSISNWDRVSEPNEQVVLAVHHFLNKLISFKMRVKLCSNGELLLDGRYKGYYDSDDVMRVYWRLHKTFYKHAPSLSDKMVNFFFNAIRSELSHCRNARERNKNRVFNDSFLELKESIDREELITMEDSMEQTENVLGMLQNKINESGNSRWLVIDYNDEGHLDLVCSVCKDKLQVKILDRFLENSRDCKKCIDMAEKESRDYYRLGEMMNWDIPELKCVIRLPNKIMDDVIDGRGAYLFNPQTSMVTSRYGLQVEVSAGMLGLMKLMLCDHNVRTVYQWKPYLGLPFGHPLMRKLAMIYDYCQHMLDRVDFRFFNISREWRKSNPIMKMKASNADKKAMGEELCGKVQQLVLMVNAISH